MDVRKLLFILLTCFSGFVYAQACLNLGFEYEMPGTNIPQKWRLNHDGYQIELDTNVKVSLAKSLRITRGSSTKNGFGGCSNSLPVELVRGKSIELKGKIKTKALVNGYAGLWLRVDGEKGALGFDNMYNRGIKGTKDWTPVSIQMKIDKKAAYINFGTLVTGEGTVWFDALEILIDGEPFTDLPPRLTEPTKEELAWLRQYIYPLKTVDPSSKEKGDLTVLKKLIGEAKVVALGEVSHGSHEIFQMKHRIIQHLAISHHFDVFSIEASMPEAYQLNYYIQEAQGNPRELIEGMYFWTWSTKEVLAMVEWMKIHNHAGQKMQFTGFDMQFHQGAIQEIRLAFKNKPDVLEKVSLLKKELDGLREQNYAAQSVNESQPMIVSPAQRKTINSLISSIKKSVSLAALPLPTKNWALQNIRIIEQYLDKTFFSRDKYMAENLMWIKAQDKHSKIVLWAHNAHIQKTGHRMGKYLSDSLAANYLTIGFSFHKGQYTAMGEKGLTGYLAQESYLGTYEYFFKALQEPMYIVDLRAAKRDNSEHGKWLRRKLEFRTVGAVKMENEFSDTNLTEDFDLLIFISQSTPSQLLN